MELDRELEILLEVAKKKKKKAESGGNLRKKDSAPNNAHGSADGSDDNLEKTSNKSGWNKRRDYIREKSAIKGEIALGISRASSTQDVNLQTYRGQGAIPKRYNRSQENIAGEKSSYHASGYRRTRSNSRNSDNTETGRHSEIGSSVRKCEEWGILPPGFIGRKASEGRVRYSSQKPVPFYYCVPQNPAAINVLPPGIYLVIPQTTVSRTPLMVYNHELASNTRPDNKSEKKKINRSGPKETSPVMNLLGRNEGKKNLFKEFPANWNIIGDSKEDLRDRPSKNESRSDAAVGKGKSFPVTFPGDKSDDLPSAREPIRDNLPPCDVDKVDGGSSTDTNGEFDELVNQIEALNSKEAKTGKELGDTDREYVQDNITNVLKGDENVKVPTEEAKLKELHLNLFHSIEPRVNRTEMSAMYDFYGGNKEEFLDWMKGEVEKIKKEDKKTQQLGQVLDMLPDVDEAFMSNKLLELNGNEAALNDFMFQLLQTGSYPKRDSNLVKLEKLWQYYVTEFTVGKFLEKVPDPEETFCVLGRYYDETSKDGRIAVTYLSRRYPMLSHTQISEEFHRRRSLTETCAQLDLEYDPVEGIDRKLFEQYFKEDLLQEIAFIANKAAILEYVRLEKERKQIERQLAAEENAFLECISCFDDEVLPSEVATCPEGHICCRVCLVSYVETSFADGKYEFLCLDETCDTEYTTGTLARFLKEALLAKIAQKKAAAEVDKAGVSGLEKCPSCDYAYVPAQGDNVFICQNRECLRETCRLCKEPNHIPLSCKEVERPQDLLARQKIEEAMTEELVRSCPNCNKRFMKLDGCNKIACPCGTILCYLCRKVINGYDHFGQGYFPGETSSSRCPLYSNNDKLHRVNVRAAGIKAKNDIEQKDPTINFVNDPTASFP